MKTVPDEPPQTLFAQGWSGGVMVLGKLPVLGRPTNLDYWTFFFSNVSLLSSFSPSLGDSPI